MKKLYFMLFYFFVSLLSYFFYVFFAVPFTLFLLFLILVENNFLPHEKKSFKVCYLDRSFRVSLRRLR